MTANDTTIASREESGAGEALTVSDAPATTTLPCPNCGTVATARARFCAGCGQRQGESLLTVRALLADLLEDVLALDGRLPRTLGGLLFRPGHLTREYAAGRITRYVRPFKLYLASSVIFFLALSISFRFDIPDEVMTSLSKPTSNEAAAREEVSAEGAEIAESKDESVNVAEAPPGAVVDTVTADTGGLAAVAVSEPSARKRRSLFIRVLESFHSKASEDPEGAIRRLIDRMLDDAPTAVFVLLPFFALFLKLLYVRRRRLYVEHLVFVLHLHAFGFLLAAPLLLVPDSWPTGILWPLIPVYLLRAMKQVYGQSWARTTFKFITFGWAYFISVVITLVTVTITAAMAAVSR
jgi:hypothetical protein